MDYSKLSLTEFLDIVTDLRSRETPIIPIDIYKYLKQYTKDFDDNKVKEVAKEVIDYIHPNFMGRVWEKYIQEGIELPITIQVGGDLSFHTGYSLTQFGFNQMDINLHYMMQVLYDKMSIIRFSESGEKNYREIPGLLVDLDHDQRILLFDKLITKGFIHERTHKESFLAAFGEPIELVNYYPVVWLSTSKQSFRELIEEFIKPITNEMIRDIETLFVHKRKPLALNKADKNPSLDILDIQKIAQEVKAFR